MTSSYKLFLICLLGALSVVSPFSIDMYLPAYEQMAAHFAVDTKLVALTISSYFIGLALGQTFYGPLLDRFGRKPPLLAGLLLFVLASLACTQASSIDQLVAFRFVQALGGCAAGVASLAMVRDLFPPDETAKILSRLFLFIALSPLLAPSVGGLLATTFGWKSVFFVLAGIVGAILLLIRFAMPESHVADKTISLSPRAIVAEYMVILRHPPFITYALAGAFSFAGLFAYVAGSPIIFMEEFGLSPRAYSAVFAFLSVGFIGASQLNVALLRRMSSEQLFQRALMLQVGLSVGFLGLTLAGVHMLAATIAFFFVFLGGTGIGYPNAAALAISSFTKNAGSAAALLGFLQLGVGALISTGIGLVAHPGSAQIIGLLAVTTSLGLGALTAGRRRIAAHPVLPNEG